MEQKQDKEGTQPLRRNDKRTVAGVAADVLANERTVHPVSGFLPNEDLKEMLYIYLAVVKAFQCLHHALFRTLSLLKKKNK